MEKLMKSYAFVSGMLRNIVAGKGVFEFILTKELFRGLDCIGMLTMIGVVFWTLGVWLALLLAPPVFAIACAWFSASLFVGG